MPELPEVEITARRLDRALRGAEVESALAPGMVTMKTFDPPLDALAGRTITAVTRRGKMPVVEFGDLALLIHLMSAGRLQLFDKRASLRDKASRLLVRIAGDGDRELRLREFGTQQRAWAKLLPVEHVERRRRRGHARAGGLPGAAVRRARLARPPAAPPAPAAARPAHDLRHRPLLGRRDPLDREALPFRQGDDLGDDDVARLHEAIDSVLGGALEHYEEVVGDSLPDKAPMPLKVHRRTGERCPRCGTKLEAVHFKDYVMTYCPKEQTGGRVLKDRRLSRLLK